MVPAADQLSEQIEGTVKQLADQANPTADKLSKAATDAAQRASETAVPTGEKASDVLRSAAKDASQNADTYGKRVRDCSSLCVALYVCQGDPNCSLCAKPCRCLLAGLLDINDMQSHGKQVFHQNSDLALLRSAECSMHEECIHCMSTRAMQTVPAWHSPPV